MNNHYLWQYCVNRLRRDYVTGALIISLTHKKRTLRNTNDLEVKDHEIRICS